MNSSNKKTIILFSNLTFEVSAEDWDFLCKYRFFSDNPSEEQIQAEFVSGTGITKNKIHLWRKASERFSEYVADLRDIMQLDVNAE